MAVAEINLKNKIFITILYFILMNVFLIPIMKYLQSNVKNVFTTSIRALRRRGDVATTSLCTSKRHRRYVSNEIPNEVSMEVAKTSQWYVSTTFYWNFVTTSQKDVTTISHHYVSTTSQTSLKWNTQRHISGTLPRRLNGTYTRLPISTSLQSLL